VVVPTHDTRALTLECVASVLASPGRWDVVVVDDGSRDGTAEALRARFACLRVVRFSAARGFSAAANAGLGAARGALLWLLNSDAAAPRDAWERLTAAFAADARLGIAGAELMYPDGRPQWSGGPKPGPLWLFAMASGLPALVSRWRRRSARGALEGAWPSRPDWVTGASLALRRSVWETVGPLDEGVRFYAQDLDLCLRARRAGFGVAIVPGLRVRHHLGASIGRGEGAWQGARPELLWCDLVRCLGRLDGPRAARQAAAALRAGARLRLAARDFSEPWLPRARRDEWRRGSEACRRGLRALESLGA
jgi:hypothetical protein